MSTDTAPPSGDTSEPDLAAALEARGWESSVAQEVDVLARWPADRRLVHEWLEAGFPASGARYSQSLRTLWRHGLSVSTVSLLEDPTRSPAAVAEYLCAQFTTSPAGLGGAIRDFAHRGGRRLDHFVAFARICEGDPARMAAAADLGADLELVVALDGARVDDRLYQRCVETGATRAELLELLAAPHARRSLQLLAAAAAQGCTPTHAATLAELGAGEPNVRNLLHLGYPLDEVVALCRAGITALEAGRYRAYCYPEATRMVDLARAGISAHALGGFHEMGVWDPADMRWCIDRGLNPLHLQLWCWHRVHHPLAVRDLQAAGVTPGLVEKAMVAAFADPAARAEGWVALEAASFRIRSGGRLMALHPAPGGLVEVGTGAPPPELTTDRAFAALGGATSRLLAVTESWEQQLRGGPPPTPLPAALTADVRGRAQRLWVADQYWGARERWPAVWEGRPPGA